MISTKGRYALRVMLDLAEQDTDKFVPLEEIAYRQGISKKYLEIIVKSLVQHDFLKGLRGKGGGYRLTRKPSDYTVEDILKLTEISMSVVSCLDEGTSPCSRRSFCRTLPMWKKFDKLTHEFFSNITLTDLLNSQI